MRILVACEFSGIVRDAFATRGHDAWSCDLLPTEKPGQHIQGDVLEHLDDGWDLMIAHPPCTFLCNSGVKHLYVAGNKRNGKETRRWRDMGDAAIFFISLLDARIDRIAIENPVMHGYGMQLIGERPNQTFHPWQFWDGEPGQGEVKRTCLWLKNLPPLEPTTPDETGRIARVHKESPGPNRWKNRSRTYQGIADAMAEQWGGYA